MIGPESPRYGDQDEENGQQEGIDEQPKKPAPRVLGRKDVSLSTGERATILQSGGYIEVSYVDSTGTRIRGSRFYR